VKKMKDEKMIHRDDRDVAGVGADSECYRYRCRRRAE
jgi:hypothetical protein